MLYLGDTFVNTDGHTETVKAHDTRLGVYVTEDEDEVLSVYTEAEAESFQSPLKVGDLVKLVQPNLNVSVLTIQDIRWEPSVDWKGDQGPAVRKYVCTYQAPVTIILEEKDINKV